jgi:hypothetical protein
MLKKASLLLLLAVAMFATPVSSRHDDPLPTCGPCPDPPQPPITR